MAAKELNGAELAGFIKERQAKQVRALRQQHHIMPRLVILMTPQAGNVIGAYVRGKRNYAEDILIDTIVELCEQPQMPEAIERWNADESVQGIIVQLPLDNPGETDEIVNKIAPHKDVDGLGARAAYPSATADAINWLCGGYNVPLESGKIAIVGQGRLVGKPLAAMWRNSGYDVTAIDVDTKNIKEIIKNSDIVVSATGAPRSITAGELKRGAVVIDAGTASENGTIVGDVDDTARERGDIIITPKKGGVGPLTIALLFDHLIQACLKTAAKD